MNKLDNPEFDFDIAQVKIELIDMNFESVGPIELELIDIDMEFESVVPMPLDLIDLDKGST